MNSIEVNPVRIIKFNKKLILRVTILYKYSIGKSEVY